MLSLVVSLSKRESVLPAPPGWIWVLLKLELRWSAVSEERVRAGSTYAATSTNPTISTVNGGRHGARSETVPLPICHAVKTKLTPHATSERALKSTVNRA